MKACYHIFVFFALVFAVQILPSTVLAAQSANESVEWGWAYFTPPRGGQMMHWQPHEKPKSFTELSYENEWTGREFLSRYHGQFVLLNFWATWCAPCVEELPSLDRLQAMLESENVTVLAFSLNEGQADIVSRFFEEHGIENLDVAVQLDDSARYVDMAGLPTTILLDPNGNEVGRFEGPAEWDSPNVMGTIGYYVRLWEELSSERIAHCEKEKEKSFIRKDNIVCE